jgi:hypothetical protein
VLNSDPALICGEADKHTGFWKHYKFFKATINTIATQAEERDSWIRVQRLYTHMMPLKYIPF